MGISSPEVNRSLFSVRNIDDLIVSEVPGQAFAVAAAVQKSLGLGTHAGLSGLFTTLILELQRASSHGRVGDLIPV